MNTSIGHWLKTLNVNKNTVFFLLIFQVQKEDVVVEYAADLPATKYGSGFPTIHGGRMTDDLDLHDIKSHPFNLNNLSRAKDSMFQIITKKQDSISGITSPWMYSGMLFASFCWHVEDLYMYSINYMHKGASKTWFNNK